jgi:predicted RND superfamily exporter protein
VFQNMGDGTYNHSGLLAIRACVAAGVNITFKILYNDAVAMTGGQSLEGGMTVPMIVNQVLAEGIEKVVVVTDEPHKYPSGAIPRGVPVYHRRDLQKLQRELRDVPGVTVADNAQGYRAIDDQITRDLPRIELIAVPLLLVLSFLVFRGLVAAALPLLIAAVAVSVTLLALRGLVEVMPISSFALNLSTGLGLGLAIDDALLIVSRHREELLAHGPGLEALKRTLATAGRTVVFSALTVGTALLCLLALPLPGLRSIPRATASRLSAPASWASLIRASRNTP